MLGLLPAEARARVRTGGGWVEIEDMNENAEDGVGSQGVWSYMSRLQSRQYHVSPIL